MRNKIITNMNLEVFTIDKRQRALDNLDLVRLFGRDDHSIDSESIKYGLNIGLYTQQDLVEAHEYSIQNRIDHYSSHKDNNKEEGKY